MEGWKPRVSHSRRVSPRHATYCAVAARYIPAANILPSPPSLRPTALALLSPLFHVSDPPFLLLVLVSSAELSCCGRSGAPALRLHCVAIRWIRLPRREPGLRTLPSLSTLDNSKLIPPNWLAGVPPRDPRMHAIIHARIYTRVFGIVDHVNSVHAARISTASDCIRERIRGRTFCPFRFGK